MQDSLSLTFQALADPTRRAMLAQLSKGDCTVSDLAKPFLKDMSLPAVTKHLKVLERAGLISKSKDAQYRPCKLKQDGLKEAVAWMDEAKTFWDESFDRLDDYLKTITKNATKKGKNDASNE
ncbi:MAG TPA: metalloregulator ArsR/SmtB family transcription factor [Oculatellaceae cyanobacterium]